MRQNSAVMFVESLMMDDDEFKAFMDVWREELETKKDGDDDGTEN